MEKLET